MDIQFPESSILSQYHATFRWNRKTLKILKKLDMDDLVKYYLSAYELSDAEESWINKRIKATVQYPADYTTEDYMMIRGTNYSPKRIMTELLKARGNLIRCAMNLGIKRSKLITWFDKNENTRAMYQEVSEIMLDYVEDKLLDNISAGDKTSITYYLNCKGTTRGYGTYEARRAVGKVIAETRSVLDKGEKFSITDWSGNVNKQDDLSKVVKKPVREPTKTTKGKRRSTKKKVTPAKNPPNMERKNNLRRDET